MIKRLVAILAVLSLSASVATAAYHITPDTLRGVTPQVGEAGDVITVDFSGTEFWDLEGSIPPNMTGSVALGGPGTIMNGIGWDTISTSFGASWGSEMTIGFSNDADLSTKELFLTVSATGCRSRVKRTPVAASSSFLTRAFLISCSRTAASTGRLSSPSMTLLAPSMGSGIRQAR